LAMRQAIAQLIGVADAAVMLLRWQKRCQKRSRRLPS